MSGPLDYPQPSSRTSRGSPSQRHPPPLPERLRTYLAERAPDRAQHLRALAAFDQELREASSEIMSPRRAELRRTDPSRFIPRRSDNTSFHARIQHPSRINESDPAVSQSRRSRSNAGQQPAPFQAGLRPREFEGVQAPQQVEDRRRQTNVSINDLFDQEPETPIRVPPLPALQHHSDDDLDPPRTKRIKLDADDRREGIHGFRYGHYGQVVPGSLEMEIASCDGGSYEAHGKKSSWPENILLNDNSVYCTKSDRCNIILRHREEAPFCLKKLVIKAPKSGFDSPNSVREGMIFVAMDDDNLLSRTSQYQIVYSSRHEARQRRHHPRHSQHPDVVRSPLVSLDQTVLADPWQWSDSDGGLNTHSGTHRFSRQTSDSGIRVTTDHDRGSEDEAMDDGSDDDSSYGINRDHSDPARQLLAPEERDTEGAENSDDDISLMTDPYYAGLLSLERVNRARLAMALSLSPDPVPSPPPRRRRQRRDTPTFVPPTDPAVNLDTGDEDPSSSAQHEVMKPHARFSIQKEKSMVNIKFDPPASGRYILIKLWSPSSGGNIDIQSVIANGFAGPRYFPSIEFR